MAVAVRLDHRHHQRRGDEVAQQPHVVPDRGQVDHDLRARGRWAHGLRFFHSGAMGQRTPATSRTAAGIAGATSPATRGPPPDARVAAAPCSQEPTDAASYGVRPAASSDPIRPVSTSPAPAVASHGTPVVVARTRPSGVAIRVRRPLSRTTASYVVAAARAWCSGRASTSARSTPAMAASSPAWGVSTAGTPSGP